MKTIILSGAALLAALTMRAQIRKQTVLLGGQLSYVSNKTSTPGYEQRTRNATIGLQAGKAYRENRVAGILLYYLPEKQITMHNGLDTTTVTSYSLEPGVFLRRYKRLAKDLYIYGHVEATFATGRHKQEFQANAGDVITTLRGGSLAVATGLTYQLLKKLQVELMIPNLLQLQYQRLKQRSDDPAIKPADQKQFLVYSNISSNTMLSWWGIGFRLVL